MSDRPGARTKRLTIDVDAALHRRFKMACAARGTNMADALRCLLEREFAAATHGNGGAPPTDTGKRASVQLRLDSSLLARIDEGRVRRTVPPSRHSWMLEALLEKLAREEEPRETRKR